MVKLKRGKSHKFASIEDMIAVSNGEMSMEKAAANYIESLKHKPEPRIVAKVTKIDHENGVVTFDVVVDERGRLELK